jgi:hypothetical protein
MRVFVTGLILGMCLSGALCRGQDSDKIACHSYPRTTESYKKKLWVWIRNLTRSFAQRAGWGR